MIPIDTSPAHADTSWTSTARLTTIKKFAVAKTNEISSEQMELRNENQELKTGLLYFAQHACISNAQHACTSNAQDLHKILSQVRSSTDC